MLKQAVFASEFAHEMLVKMRESLANGGPPTREAAQAVAAIGRLWDAAQGRVAFWGGVPGPGSRRPADEPVKGKRRWPSLTPRPPSG